MKKPVPVIKWAGGKRQLISQIIKLMPEKRNKYYEPFFGGGALFFELMPKSAIINDANKQLINMYKQVKEDPDGVCSELFNLERQYNDKETIEEKDALYYELRKSYNNFIANGTDTKSSHLAALLIFLNKSGFNGLYRVNASGLYNVGSSHRKNVKAYDEENIIAVSRSLQKTEISCGDFESACGSAKEGDFIFFDPPYYETFDSYQAGGFCEADHVRLFKLFKTLSDNGVNCLLTYNDCDFVKNLYKDFASKIVDVKRTINNNCKNRIGKDVIVTNYNIKCMTDG